MMSMHDFLSKVLAPEDNYVLYIARGKRASWNENYGTLESCVQAAQNHDKNDDETVYISVGSFANNVGPHPKTGRDYVQRKKAQASKFKAFAADLDVDPAHDQKYDTQKDATKALLTACDALTLPRPMIVLSGNGVHAWWPLKESISADIWERMSLSLRAALESKGVLLDVSKVSDRSMVLRPVGSHHKKDPSHWKPVRLVMDQPERPVMEFAEVLKEFKVAAPVANGRGNKTKMRRQSAILDAIIDGGTPIKLDDMHRCPQLSAILNSHGATDATGNEVLEPLWRATMGIAKFCEDKEAAVVELSKGHPDFELETAIEKMERYQGTGPTNCATFEMHCPSPCETCEHRGTITSPGQLTGGATSIEVPVVVEDEDGEESVSIETQELPPNYSVKQNSIFYRHPIRDEEVFVSPYLMWVTARVTDADENTNHAQIDVVFPQGVKTISVDSATIAAGGNDLRKELASKQVYIKEDIDPLRNYLMTYLRKLQAGRAADVSYNHFGWQKDGTFLVGGKVLGASIETHIHYDGAAKKYVEALEPTGSLKKWTSISRIFDLPGMEMQNFVATLAMAAPLMKFTSLPSALVNMYSPDSGSGKTLTGLFGLSVWGDPKALQRATKDTDAAFYKHFGTLSNFGGYVDEITTIDPERMRTIVMTLQDGKERERVRQSADGFRDVAHWQMPVITSSNKDAYELLGARITSEAEQVRVLQLPCPRTAFFDKKGTKLGYQFHRAVCENYGLAGPLLIAEVIAQGGGQVVFDKAARRFDEMYGFEFMGLERFFMALCYITEAMGQIATDLGLIGYDYKKGINACLQEIIRLRDRRSNQTFDGFDTLFQFLNENQSEIVYWHELPNRSYALQPTPRAAVARVELQLDDHDRVMSGLMYINRSAYRKWCRRNGAEYNSTIERMRDEGADVTEHLRKTLYKGVIGASSAGQTHCFAIDIMSHQRLIEASDNSVESASVIGRRRIEDVSEQEG